MSYDYFRYNSYVGSTNPGSKKGVFNTIASQLIGDALFAWTSTFSFQTAIAGDWQEQSLATFNNHYSNPPFGVGSSTGNFNVVKGAQLLKIPKTGTYRIKAAGAGGGTPNYYSGYTGGGGYIYQGDFVLSKEQVIRIVVGGRGGKWGYTAGGGGASHVGKVSSFTSDVTMATSDLLVMAGGGGGGGGSGGAGTNATGNNNGTNGYPSGDYGAGGANGYGGGRVAGGGGWGQGGAGFLGRSYGSNGTHSNYQGSDYAYAQNGSLSGYYRGANGSHGTGYTSNIFDWTTSSSCYGAPGGFGGGGSGQCNGGGGGGGYSGGGGGGGGGGSYIASSATNVVGSATFGYVGAMSDGFVTITPL